MPLILSFVFSGPYWSRKILFDRRCIYFCLWQVEYFPHLSSLSILSDIVEYIETGKKWLPFCTRHFLIFCMKIVVFWFKYYWSLFLIDNKSAGGLVNVLALKRRQAIMWTNDGFVTDAYICWSDLNELITTAWADSSTCGTCFVCLRYYVRLPWKILVRSGICEVAKVLNNDLNNWNVLTS